jgi:uncharacterized membrane protein YfcA
MVIAALGVGITKSGLTGVSMVHVLIFASIFDARESTGIVLPMLIFGDAAAMVVYGKHANWTYIRKMLGPTLVGIMIGAIAMQFLSGAAYRPLLGVIILGLVTMQIVRIRHPHATENIPHALWFAWSMGILGGAMTMIANGAGPVFAIYFLAVGLPKMELVGTGAWFFLLMNLLKVPFSWGLGLIKPDTLMLNAMLCPFILLGLWAGVATVRRIPQKQFDLILLAMTAMIAVGFLVL